MTETNPFTEALLPISTIAKTDASGGLRAFSYAPEHPAMAIWVHPRTGFLHRLASEITMRGVHPARCVVLLPYAQLLPLATRLWAQCFPEGFAPRFETTLNWSTALGGQAGSATDIRFDMGLDTLTAQALLLQAGLGAQQEALGGILVQAAHQLAPLAAGVGPQHRAQWAQEARHSVALGMEGAALAWESAVSRIALEWAAVSAYASDVLFSEPVQVGVDCLVIVRGLAPDPLANGLRDFWGDKLLVLPLAQQPAGAIAVEDAGLACALHACGDAEDEAQRTVACALTHIEAGRYPLALVSSDRALTRRVRAMLEAAQVQMRDENGWKLSTSRAAAQLMAFLRAGAWNASADTVLNWLKAAPFVTGSIDALEAALRRDQVRDWCNAPAAPHIVNDPALLAACTSVDTLRGLCAGQRPLPNWIGQLRSGLQHSGMWDALLAESAGAKVISVLRLDATAKDDWKVLAEGALWSMRRMNLAEFTAWVNQALEGASFQPEYPAEEQVVFLPMSQMLGRPFAAVVLAGCDEVRLNPNVEPPGGWTSAQRAALGLPSRDALEALVRSSWRHALQTPACDVLWRTSDEAGEPLLPSNLVQLMQMAEGPHGPGADPRGVRAVQSAPVEPPLPIGAAVPVHYLSASAYEDLRQCPYRFFALRQLGLKAVDELESEVDKRDFGLWLHAVLSAFHASLAEHATAQNNQRVELLDAAADATTRSMGLPDGEFLPFAAAWPAVRHGYLHWLAKHEAEGATFVSGETALTQRLGGLTLVGRIDRIDALPDGRVLVLDYKTEPGAKTKARVKDSLEDTQIAFYAALLPHDTLRAGYVNVGERDGTIMSEQKQVVQARDALVEGMLGDMQRIAQGATLPALGDGAACDFCQARGLCRKDFWSVA